MPAHIYQGDAASGDLSGTYPSPAVSPNAALARLPRYASVALAGAGGLASGSFFVLTGIALGLNTVNIVVQLP